MKFSWNNIITASLSFFILKADGQVPSTDIWAQGPQIEPFIIDEWQPNSNESISDESIRDGIFAQLINDDELIESFKNYELSKLDYLTKSLKEREKVFKSVNRMGISIFVLTHVFLLTGFWMAFQEFGKAKSIRSKEPENQEIQVSLEGIAFKTSLHGSFIFGLTIVLYFLFLKFVYPIHFV